MNPNSERTIYERYIPVTETGCWLWEGEVNKKGYGLISVRGKYFIVHRLSFTLSKGSIPEGHHVCHSCDVRSCINPDHLFLGTPKENVQDAIRKERMSILTGEQVKEIRRLRAEYGISSRRLGDRFGVSRQNINDITKRRTWKHL